MDLFPTKIVTFPPPDFPGLPHERPEHYLLQWTVTAQPGNIIPSRGLDPNGRWAGISASVRAFSNRTGWGYKIRTGATCHGRGAAGSSCRRCLLGHPTRLALDHLFVVHFFAGTDFKVPVGPLQFPFAGVERIYFGIHFIVRTTYLASFYLNGKSKENSPYGTT